MRWSSEVSRRKRGGSAALFGSVCRQFHQKGKLEVRNRRVLLRERRLRELQKQRRLRFRGRFIGTAWR